MTRDEAIRVLKEYIALDKDIYNEYLEAQRVAIEALKREENPNSIRINFVGEKEAEEFKEYLKNQQESVLDKIRTEIEGKYRVILKGAPKDDWVERWNDCLDEVLKIIDKYKAESEGLDADSN